MTVEIIQTTATLPIPTSTPASKIIKRIQFCNYCSHGDPSSLNPSLVPSTATPPPLNASCVAAGFTGCCTSFCSVGNCFCDFACHSFNDCCEDINDTCPFTSIVPSPSGQFILHIVIHDIVDYHLPIRLPVCPSLSFPFSLPLSLSPPIATTIATSSGTSGFTTVEVIPTTATLPIPTSTPANKIFKLIYYRVCN